MCGSAYRRWKSCPFSRGQRLSAGKLILSTVLETVFGAHEEMLAASISVLVSSVDIENEETMLSRSTGRPRVVINDHIEIFLDAVFNCELMVGRDPEIQVLS